MLKKSLIALALAGAAVSGVANAAATVTSGAVVNVALEGNLDADLGNKTIAPGDLTAALTITTGTSYIVNDLVVITVEGAKFDKTATPTLVPGAVGTTFSFVDYSDDNTARFRVSTADEAAATVLTFAAWSLDTTGATDKAKIKFTSTAISTNALIGEYDKSTATEVAAFRTQYTNAITKLNGEVSTGAGRAEFTTSANLDELTVTPTNNSGDVDALTVTKVVHTIKGNFSWLMDYDAGAKDGSLSAAELASAIAFTPTGGGADDAVAYSINTALDTITATVTVTGAIDTAKFGFKNIGNAAGGSVIVAPQSFTIGSVASDASNNTITLADASAGAFTLDGSTANIAFLPFGSDYAQSITVTNPGTVEGAITVDLTANGTTYTKTLSAIATAKSVTNISLEVAAFAAESGVDGNARVSVTVNAPNIETEGLYFHKPTADRVLVPNQ